ncbi:hypothetical protein chiPu_0022906, partial [Chiloscyllium punctatum]|nr:hypothetical protein [Chiloscyllium punctatum]
VSVKESAAEEKLTPVTLANQVAGLKRHLMSLQLEQVLGPDATIDLTDPEGALAKRLLTQLDMTRSRKEGGSPTGREAGQVGNANTVTYELYYRPEQTRFTQAAKVRWL